MANKKWTLDQMSRQDGKIAVVTGANSGLGFHTSKALALKGAKVIMACRNPEKGEAARKLILEEPVMAEPEVWELDLASLESVKHFADKFTGKFNSLDLLVNNAGLMAIPYGRTADGFEMQFGVNHLGHFALSALIWPSLAGTGSSRVVQLSSLAHRFGRINYDDPHWERGYSKWAAYGMSKLANLLFVKELAGRILKNGQGVTVAGAHPGYADTELQAKGALMNGNKTSAAFMNLINKLVAQPGEKGALPTLYAATEEDVQQGAYYGPGGPLKLFGWPVPDAPSIRLVNDRDARRLWELSETLTGIDFSV